MTSDSKNLGGAATTASSNIPAGVTITDELQELSIFDNTNTLNQTGQISAVKRSYNFDQTGGESVHSSSPFTRNDFGNNATMSTMHTLDKFKDHHLT